MGLEVEILPNALKGIEYLAQHPEARTNDLIQAFTDDTIDMILCAIGGDDTYRLLPYLLENDAFKNVLTNKIFLGFSDTTWNHMMFHRLGLSTFYGQAFLTDVCELSGEMLPYSKRYFEELIETGTIAQVKPSSVWYEERHDFSKAALGTHRIQHRNTGFELLQGNSTFSGELLGGCLESLYDMLDNTRYADSVTLCEKYQIFPSLEEWRGKILLLETSEEQPSAKRFEQMLRKLKETGMFSVVSGVLVGKPMDEVGLDVYRRVLVEVIDNETLPILYNVNIGHATPRVIMPLGKTAHVDADNQVIQFL